MVFAPPSYTPAPAGVFYLRRSQCTRLESNQRRPRLQRVLYQLSYLGIELAIMKAVDAEKA